MFRSIPRQQAQSRQPANAHVAYGPQLASYFHLKMAPALALVSPGGSQIVATRLRSESALPDRTSSIPPERAFVIPVHLHPAAAGCYEVWMDGRHTRVDTWSVGGIGIYNLESNPVWRISGAFDVLCFHVPRSMLRQFTEENDLASVDMLGCPEGTVDPVLVPDGAGRSSRADAAECVQHLVPGADSVDAVRTSRTALWHAFGGVATLLRRTGSVAEAACDGDDRGAMRW